jgi:hypothetical protein
MLANVKDGRRLVHAFRVVHNSIWCYSGQYVDNALVGEKLVNVADCRGVSKVANAMLRRTTRGLERDHCINGVGLIEATTRGGGRYIYYMAACGFCCGALQPVVVCAKLEKSRQVELLGPVA